MMPIWGGMGLFERWQKQYAADRASGVWDAVSTPRAQQIVADWVATGLLSV